MASVKVFPRLDKANAQRKVPIYLRVTKNRKSKYIALDAYIFSKDWNKETCKVKSTASNASHINAYISSKVAETERIAVELETRSKAISAYDIKSKILGKSPADFFDFTKKQEKRLFEELSVGAYRRYKAVVKKLKLCCKKEVLYFDEIDVKFVKDFHGYMMLERKNHVNTIHSNLKVLRKNHHRCDCGGVDPQ